MNNYDPLNRWLKIIFAVVLLWVVSACGGTEPTEVATEEEATDMPVSTETPAPTETSVPTETAVPTPDVVISVGNITRDPFPISAGESTEIGLQFSAGGEVRTTYSVDRGAIIQQNALSYEYTAPEEGGLDTVRFEVAPVNNVDAAARPEFVFRVIDVKLESPIGEVPCDSRSICGFNAQGTVDGITGEMAVVLFVKPDDSDVWTVHRAAEIMDEGAWEVNATVRQEPVFAGTRFVVRALVLPEEDALLLPSEVPEPPPEPLGKSDISQVDVISGRARFGQPDDQVTITSPFSGSPVPHDQPISILGDATGVPTDGVLWAMVYAPVGEYWPQSPTSCQNLLGTPIKEDGQWEIPNVTFGGEGEMQFDVVAVLAESGGEIDVFFQEYLADACRSRDFPGLVPSELPGELSEAASVTVIARD